MTNRPDLERFEVGAHYKHQDTDEVVEFIGLASMPELAGEDVAVFRYLEGGCLIATLRGYMRGELFRPLRDAIEDEMRLED